MHRAEARTRLAPLTEISLFLDSLADIEAGKSPEDVAEAYRRRRTAARAQQALVMEFRLASEALSVAMGGREKMILDTDRLPSWFQLWLLLGDKRQPPIIPPREPGLPERSPLER